MNIVLHRVNLGNVEVCPDLLLDELVLVCVKMIPCIFEPSEGMVGVGLEVSIVNEVKNGAGCLYDFQLSCVGNNAKKNRLHVLVLVSSPLRDERYPFLEMMKARVSGHHLKTSVDLVFSTNERVCDPFDEMIFENTLMELTKDIGGER